MGYFNLDDNMIVQKGAFIIAILIFLEWLIVFIIRIFEGNIYYLETVAYFGNAAPVFGTVMFNYAMVITVPSWCNEKTHGTSINKSLAYSIIVGTILFLFIGVLGGISYKISETGDLLSAIDASPQGGLISSICVYLFPISVVATSIPIYSIIVRYNLLENKICGKPMANFIGVILPWLVTIPFYTGKGLSNVINWSSLIAGGIINFIIPFWIYVRARDYKRYKLSALEREETDEKLGPQFNDPDEYYCWEHFKIKGKHPSAPHFAFHCLSDNSTTGKIIAYTFMASLTIAVVGVFIINILGAVGIE